MAGILARRCLRRSLSLAGKSGRFCAKGRFRLRRLKRFCSRPTPSPRVCCKSSFQRTYARILAYLHILKNLNLIFVKSLEEGTKSPLQKAGATQPRDTKKPPGWEALDAILYRQE